MKWLLTLASCALFSLAVAKAPVSGARLLSPSDMQRAPQTAVIMTQCNLLIAGYFTLQDGTLAKVDQRSQKDFPDVNDVLRWGDTAAHGAERVDAQCSAPGAAQHTNYRAVSNPPAAPAAPAKANEVVAFVEFEVCHEKLAVMFLKEEGFSLIRRQDEDSKYWTGLLDKFEAVKRSAGPAYTIPLKDDCVST